jgi:molybdopterin molybdotransferase
MIRMASVEQALQLLAERGRAHAMPAETITLAEASGRCLAEPVIAKVSLPAAPVSAMDGYAVRFADMAQNQGMNAELTVIGESRAGAPYSGSIGPKQAVRIFTGAVIPAGCDHILIQEDCIREGDAIEVMHAQPSPANIRRKGRDFSEGAVLVPAGHAMTPGAISLAAAGNVATLSVRKRPVVGVLANGDELVEPGSHVATGQVVNSIQPALLELLSRWGAAPISLGIAADDEADVRRRIAAPCDLILTIGGASVGDYDVVRSAFAADGFTPLLEKIAVKPGKPTWLSEKSGRLVLGLPGNPAAAMVTARLFLRPLLDTMLNAARPPAAPSRARATKPLPASGNREEYLRAVLAIGADGLASVTPAEDQDSSLLSPFLTANVLIRRPLHSPPAPAGELVEIVNYD